MKHYLASRFASQAENETRVIHIIGPEYGVPAGSYPVLEYYCTDHDCDCLQVYLHVMNDATQACEAIVSFGWEPIAFYQQWNHGVIDEVIRDFKGPALCTMMPQGPFSLQWLKVIKHLLKSDKKYVKRLEMHYRLMKQTVHVKQ